MSKWLSLFVVCLSCGLAAADDDELIKNYAQADFEKFVKEELKKDFQKAKLNVGFEYAIKDTGYGIVFFAQQKCLLFHATIPKEAFSDSKEVTMQKIHDWNVKALHSRAYFVEDGRNVRYEGTLSFAAGLTPNQVKAFYVSLELESVDFLRHLGGLKTIKGGDKDGPKKDAKDKARDI